MGSATYRMCKLLIARGKINGMQRKLDMFLAYDRITDEEYAELCQELAAKIAQIESETNQDTTNG